MPGTQHGLTLPASWHPFHNKQSKSVFWFFHQLKSCNWTDSPFLCSHLVQRDNSGHETCKCWPCCARMCPISSLAQKPQFLWKIGWHWRGAPWVVISSSAKLWSRGTNVIIAVPNWTTTIITQHHHPSSECCGFLLTITSQLSQAIGEAVVGNSNHNFLLLVMLHWWGRGLSEFLSSLGQVWLKPLLTLVCSMFHSQHEEREEKWQLHSHSKLSTRFYCSLLVTLESFSSAWMKCMRVKSSHIAHTSKASKLSNRFTTSSDNPQPMNPSHRSHFANYHKMHFWWCQCNQSGGWAGSTHSPLHECL